MLNRLLIIGTVLLSHREPVAVMANHMLVKRGARPTLYDPGVP